MKTIVNDYIPFKGFKAINLFGLIFVRRGAQMKPRDYNHEAIHTAQMKELFYISFYMWYFLEWLYHLVRLLNFKRAYKAISFEREAFANQSNYKYLDNREAFTQWKKK